MKKIIARLILPAALLMGLAPLIKGQQYFQKMIHNGSTYPPAPGGKSTMSMAGIQLTGTTKGIVNFATTDGVLIFNSMLSNGTYAPNNTDQPCSGAGLPTFETKVKISHLHSSFPSIDPSTVPADVVEVDSARGIMAVTGRFTVGLNSDLFVMLIDAGGKVYLTEIYGVDSVEEVGNAICTNPLNNNYIYITGYSRKNNSAEKKILAMKLEYRFNTQTNQASLIPVWNGEYHLGAGRPLKEDPTVINETGNDIYCDNGYWGNTRLYIAGSAYFTSSGIQKGFVMELNEKGDVLPAAFPLNLQVQDNASSFNKIGGTRDGWVYFAGECQIRKQEPMLGVYQPQYLTGSPYGWEIVPYHNRDFEAYYNVRSMLISNASDHIYLFADDNASGLQNASLIVIDRAKLANPLVVDTVLNIRFNDRLRDTTDNWLANDITENVQQHYMTLHSSYTPFFSVASTEIDNIYHNGERGEFCGDIHRSDMISGQCNSIPRKFIRYNAPLPSLQVCEIVHHYPSTHICSSVSDPDGGIMKNTIQTAITGAGPGDITYYPSILENTYTVNVMFDHDINENVSINCYDETGRKVDVRVNRMSNSKLEIVFSSSLAKGMYFILLQQAEMNHSLKVIRY